MNTLLSFIMLTICITLVLLGHMPYPCLQLAPRPWTAPLHYVDSYELC